MQRGVVVVGVFVAAKDADGIATDSQARAGNRAAVDGVAHCAIGGACSLCSHIALGGKAGHQVIARSERGFDSALRNGFADGLRGFVAGMQEEMDVGVDEAGHQGGVTEVDDFCVRGMRNAGAGGANAFALDEDFAGRDEAAVLDVEQVGGVENL